MALVFVAVVGSDVGVDGVVLLCVGYCVLSNQNQVPWMLIVECWCWWRECC